jgi:transcriptional regulator with XRE-family HTH domain
MARLLRVSQPTYSKYETGRLIPPFHIKARIAAILGVSARDVFPEPSAQSKGAA